MTKKVIDKQPIVLYHNAIPNKTAPNTSSKISKKIFEKGLDKPRKGAIMKVQNESTSAARGTEGMNGRVT